MDLKVATAALLSRLTIRPLKKKITKKIATFFKYIADYGSEVSELRESNERRKRVNFVALGKYTYRCPQLAY